MIAAAAAGKSSSFAVIHREEQSEETKISEVIEEEFAIPLEQDKLGPTLSLAIVTIKDLAASKWGGDPEAHKTRIIDIEAKGRYKRAPWLNSHERLVIIHEYERFELMIDHDFTAGDLPDLGAGPRILVKVAARER